MKSADNLFDKHRDLAASNPAAHQKANAFGDEVRTGALTLVLVLEA